jgi:hypothetical protein
VIHGDSAPTIASNDAATGLDSTSQMSTLLLQHALTNSVHSERRVKVGSSICIRIQHLRRNGYFVHRSFEHTGHDKC